MWWLCELGLLPQTADSRLGARARQRDMLIGSTRRELHRRYGVAIKPCAVAASGRTLSFAVGSDAVIWATGYRSDYSWLELPALDGGRRPRRRRGVTEVPGSLLPGALLAAHARLG